jgi:hypothetical protein
MMIVVLLVAVGKGMYHFSRTILGRITLAPSALLLT